MKGLVRQFLVMCLLLTIALVGQAYGQTDPVTVVANSSVANSQISAKQLRRIFSMRQSNWANALSMFPYQIERMWNKFAYSGLGVKPIVVKNENEMLKMVAQTEGSIGYVGALKIPNGVITMTVVKE
jgi:ABC-type phosphate transport system substrate-binding protein